MCLRRVRRPIGKDRPVVRRGFVAVDVGGPEISSLLGLGRLLSALLPRLLSANAQRRRINYRVYTPPLLL